MFYHVEHVSPFRNIFVYETNIQLTHLYLFTIAYGPHNWWRISRTCKGPNQSPIDIITSNALEMGIESPVELAMDDPTGKNVIEGTLINNG